jgi:hypothetical protein
VTARSALLLAVALTYGASAEAQEPTPSPSPAPPPTEASPPPEGFKAGPFLVVPRLRIDTIGIDANVLDADEERRADFLAIGGPALEVSLPLRSSAALTAEAHGSYVYYARTASQRRLVGGGSVALSWDTGRTSLVLRALDDRRYERLGEELDRRLEQRDRAGQVDLRRRMLGRLGVRASAQLVERTLPDDEEQGGLAASYDRTELLTRAGLDYSLTYKTRLLVEVERTEGVFQVEDQRDGRFEGVRGGIETDTSALVSGHVLVGRRRFKRAEAAALEDPTFTFVDVDATLNLSKRTRLGVLFAQDQSWSALSSAAEPIVQTRRFGVHGSKDVYSRIVLAARAVRTEFERDVGMDRRDEATAEIVYLWRRFGVGFRAGHVRSPEGAFVRSGAFEGTIGGLILTYR